MERSAKEAKKARKEKSGPVMTVKETLERIRDDNDASIALRKLRDQGLDEQKVAAYVFSYCGGGIETINKALSTMEWFAGILNECAIKVREAADYLETTMKICDQHNQPLLDEEEIVRLRKVAKLLSDAASRRAQIVKRTRVGGDGKKEIITSGRAHVLLRFGYALQRSEVNYRKNLPNSRQTWNPDKHKKPSIGVCDRIASLMAPVLDESNPRHMANGESLRKAIEREARSEFDEQCQAAGELQLTKEEFDQFLLDRGEDDYEDLRLKG